MRRHSALDVERVLTDQHVPQAGGDVVRVRRVEDRFHDLRRGIDLADADDAFVGVDAHDEVVLAAVGDGAVDHGLPQDDGFDFGDLHAGAPLGRRCLEFVQAKMSATRSPVATAWLPTQLSARKGHDVAVGRHRDRLELAAEDVADARDHGAGAARSRRTRPRSG